MSVIGIDPGLNGALALYDYKSGALDVQDMPTWTQIISNKPRQRVDPIALLEFFELAKMSGVELAVIEAVGGRPKQSASGGFAFGYSVGLVYMACVACKVPIEGVAPQTWKKLMRVPGKVKGSPKLSDEAILLRAQELFPDERDKFYGTKGGKRVDRAEAAMLAKYAADHALRAVSSATLDHAARFRESVNAP